MNKDKLIVKLNWFFNLELSQVDFYSQQCNYIDDYYMRRVFKHFANIEQQHVDNVASLIKSLGGKPWPILDFVSPIIGKTAGKILSLSGIENLLKVNIAVEKKAKADYQALIDSIKGDYNDKVITELQNNLIDEDLHIAWLSIKLNALKKRRKGKRVNEIR